MTKKNRTADRVQAALNFIGGDDRLDMLIAGRARLTFEIIPRLTDLTLVKVVGGKIDLHDFFQTRQGLFVDEGFTKIILSRASRGTVSFSDTTIGHADVLWEVTDSDIVEELPKEHVAQEVDAFLGVLASLIMGQVDGMEGDLKVTHHNLLKIKIGSEVLVVGVCWTNTRDWYCNAFPFAMYSPWRVGDRAFSATVA